MAPRRRIPDAPVSQNKPKGTAKNPWFLVREHIQADGTKVEAHFIRYTKTGIYKTKEIPKGAAIRQENYLR